MQYRRTACINIPLVEVHGLVFAGEDRGESRVEGPVRVAPASGDTSDEDVTT